MDKLIDIKISDKVLSVDACYNFVLDQSCGGNALFIGTVRDMNKGEAIKKLAFESYVEMAIKEMKKIAYSCLEKFDAKKIALHHRIGDVGLEEIAVVIAVSAKHRKAAFEACEFAIDELKKSVPIWKKEYLENGSYWVNARP